MKRPYTLLYNNIRAILNELIMLMVLGIYGYYRAFVDPTTQDTLSVSIMPAVIIALLVICIVMNSVFMIKYWYDQRRSANSEAKEREEMKLSKLEPDMNAQFMEETKLRLANMTACNQLPNRFVMAPSASLPNKI